MVRLLLCLALLLAGIADGASAARNRWPPALQAALSEAGIPRDAVALYVHEVGGAEPLLEWNADQPMNPASTMKLVTTLAALEVLGPAFTWRTEVYTRGSIAGGVLDGDLVLKGTGDPRLTLDSFAMLLRDLRMRGIRDIRGDLVVDRSYFAPSTDDPGRFDNEPARPYNVQPDALLINFKSVRLQFVPQDGARKVEIFAVPALPEISIVNQLALGPASCDSWPERPQLDYPQARLVFTGIFPAGCGERSREFALLTPNQYAWSVFRQLWQELGGTIGGRLREGPVPPDAVPLVAWESPPLAEVIRDINKFSSNVMARHVFLTLATAAAPPPATTHGGAAVVRAWLSRIGIEMPELVLENGAGLSRIERISARSMGRLLLHGFNAPLMPEYLASLPILGMDGTLRRRLNGSASAGQAHLKTGYLEGVRAMGGYIRDPAGRWTVVVALVNHPGAVAAQGFQDALIEWAYQRSAGGESPQRTPGCCGRPK